MITIIIQIGKQINPSGTSGQQILGDWLASSVARCRAGRDVQSDRPGRNPRRMGAGCPRRNQRGGVLPAGTELRELPSADDLVGDRTWISSCCNGDRLVGL